MVIWQPLAWSPPRPRPVPPWLWPPWRIEFGGPRDTLERGWSPPMMRCLRCGRLTLVRRFGRCPRCAADVMALLVRAPRRRLRVDVRARVVEPSTDTMIAAAVRDAFAFGEVTISRRHEPDAVEAQYAARLRMFRQGR